MTGNREAPAPASAPWRWRTAAIAGIVLAVDLISKLAATSHGPVLYNPGIAFGLLATRAWMAGAVSALALAAVMWMAWRWSRSWLTALAWGLILGGAWGNTIDRYLFSGGRGVTDWIHVSPYAAYFNLADAAIRIGTVLLIIDVAATMVRGRTRPVAESPLS